MRETGEDVQAEAKETDEKHNQSALRWYGVILLLIAVLIAAFDGCFLRVCQQSGMRPIGLLGWRFLLSGLVMLALELSQHADTSIVIKNMQDNMDLALWGML